MRKGGMGVVSLDVWIWKQEAPTAQPPIAGGDRPETATGVCQGSLGPATGGHHFQNTTVTTRLIDSSIRVHSINRPSIRRSSWIDPHAQWRTPRYPIYMIMCRGGYRISCIISYRFWPPWFFKWYHIKHINHLIHRAPGYRLALPSLKIPDMHHTE